MFKEYDYENKPVVDIVNEMIIDAINKNASDIHFDPTEDVLNVRIRIDGELLEYAKVPNFVKKNLLTRIKIISGMNITESRLPQDGAIKNLTDKIDLDLRVSSLPIVDGEKIVIRILNYTMSNNGLNNLGLSENNLEKINHLIKTPNGIIMVAGATGSGKSTTVYSMLQILNTVNRNIITVEDPVEMKIAGINQVQVMSDIGLTFGNTLRSILRQDPDIIMIGEIRDSETARIAVRASITGHLVLSTIHTNNSLNTIERLLDMDVERYLLGSALEGIISQRLVKKLCPKCREARETTPYEKVLFEKVLNRNVDSIYTAKGCDECINGYLGRTALHEILVINQDVRDAIVSNVRKDELRRLVYKKSDVINLLQDGLEKVLNGLTSIDEILRVIDVDDDFGEDEEELKAALIGKTPTQESTIIENDLLEEIPQNLNNDQNIEVVSNEALTNDQTAEPISYENSNINDQTPPLDFDQTAVNNITNSENIQDQLIDSFNDVVSPTTNNVTNPAFANELINEPASDTMIYDQPINTNEQTQVIAGEKVFAPLNPDMVTMEVQNIDAL